MANLTLSIGGRPLKIQCSDNNIERVKEIGEAMGSQNACKINPFRLRKLENTSEINVFSVRRSENANGSMFVACVNQEMIAKSVVLVCVWSRASGEK